MRFQVFVVLAAFLLAHGCSGTARSVQVSYDDARNRTTYRAPSIRIPIETRGSGYGSQFNQLRMTLRARCEGEACQPSMVTMTLSTGGSSELFLGDRTLRVEADDERFTWADPRGDRDDWPQRVVGMVVQVRVAVEQLRAMAEAERLRGTIGAVTLNMSTRNQARIRAFLDRMEGAPESGM